MSEWKKVKLDDCLELITYGFTNPMPDSMSGPWKVTAKDIVNGKINYSSARHTSKEAFENELTDKSRPIKNDLLLTKDGTLGRLAIVGDEVICINQSVALLRVKKNLFYVPYLYYLLSTPLFQGKMLADAGGSTIKHIYITRVNQLYIPCPSYEEQIRLATTLSRYDSLIENYQKQIKLLEEAAQRLYKEWFVDLHFPGHENTKIVDGVPEGWEKKMIGEFCDTTSGGTPSRSKTEFYTGNIPWVKTKELDDDFIFDTEEKITEEAIRKSSAKLIPSGSILMAMYGATIGKLGIATKELSCNQACCVFLLSEDNILRFYLYSWLLYNRTMLISMGKGAAQPNLSQDMIKKLEIVIPSLHLLTIFDSKVKSTYKKVYHLSSQIRLLTEARDRLLPKLMTGEIELEGEKRPERPTIS